MSSVLGVTSKGYDSGARYLQRRLNELEQTQEQGLAQIGSRGFVLNDSTLSINNEKGLRTFYAGPDGIEITNAKGDPMLKANEVDGLKMVGDFTSFDAEGKEVFHAGPDGVRFVRNIDGSVTAEEFIAYKAQVEEAQRLLGEELDEQATIAASATKASQDAQKAAEDMAAALAKAQEELAIAIDRASVNLAANGSFEMSDTRGLPVWWDAPDGTTSSIISGGRDGNKALQLKPTSGLVTYNSTSTAANVTSGRLIEVTVWANPVLSPSPNAKLGLDISYASTSSGSSFSKTFRTELVSDLPAGEWWNLSAAVTVPAGYDIARPGIRVTDGAGGTYLFDRVEILDITEREAQYEAVAAAEDAARAAKSAAEAAKKAADDAMAKALEPADSVEIVSDLGYPLLIGDKERGVQARGTFDAFDSKNIEVFHAGLDGARFLGSITTRDLLGRNILKSDDKGLTLSSNGYEYFKVSSGKLALMDKGYEVMSISEGKMTLNGNYWANKIGANEIQAGSITADKLVVGQGLNLIPNGSLESMASAGGTSMPWNSLFSVEADRMTLTSPPGAKTMQAMPGELGWFDVEPNAEYVFEVNMASTGSDSKIFLELRDQDGNQAGTQVANSNRTDTAWCGGGPYLMNNVTLTGSYQKFTCIFKTGATARRVRLADVYFNHPNGGATQAKVWWNGMKFMPRFAEGMLMDGAVVASSIASNAVTADKLHVNALNYKTAVGMKLTSSVIQTTASADRGVKIDTGGIKAYDNNGNVTMNLSGSSNYFKGTIYSGNYPNAPYTSINDSQWDNFTGIQMMATKGQMAGIKTNTTYDTRYGSSWDPGSLYLSSAPDEGTGMMSEVVVGTSGIKLTTINTRSNTYWSYLTANDKNLFLYSPKSLELKSVSKLLVSSNGAVVKLTDSATVDIPWYKSFDLQLTSQGNGTAGVLVSSNAGMGTLVKIRNPPTTTYAANVLIDSNGTVYKTSSARRFKLDIRDATDEVDPWNVLDVPPRMWHDKEHAERSEDVPLVPGVIAEEVEAAGLPQFVVYDEGGTTQGVAYDRLWTLLLPVVKEINARLEALERSNA